MAVKGHILICGASFAGLATAFWMKQLGYKVTVIEIADSLRRGGTPVDIKDRSVEIVKRMGLFEQVVSNRLPAKSTELIDAAGVAVLPSRKQEDEPRQTPQEYEIERDVLLNLLYDVVKDDVTFIFGDSITELEESESNVSVSFRRASRRSFHLVFGCDGVHSFVRRCKFGADKEFSHFLKAYGSVSIVKKLLIPENTSQLYNEPGRAIVIGAYNNKTDIILIFTSETEISYDYRDDEQKRKIVVEQFSGVGWRTRELLEEMNQSDNLYFTVLSQIKMKSWTKGRIALVGDAAYCASPAAGRGGSLAIDGAAALADGFRKYGDDFNAAFREYDESFRPFIEEVQADTASFGVEFLVPRTAGALFIRNAKLAGNPEQAWR